MAEKKPRLSWRRLRRNPEWLPQMWELSIGGRLLITMMQQPHGWHWFGLNHNTLSRQVEPKTFLTLAEAKADAMQYAREQIQRGLA